MEIRQYGMRFADEESWRLAVSLIVPRVGLRIADYGRDDCAEAPIWMWVAELVHPEQYSVAQREQWKACGRVDL